VSEDSLKNGIFVIPKPSTDLSDDQMRSYSYISKQGKTVTVPYFPPHAVYRFFRETFGVGVSIVDRKEKSGIVYIETPARGSLPANRIYNYIRAFSMEYFTTEDGRKVPHVIDFEGAAIIENGNVANASHAAATNAFKELIKMFAFGLSVFDKYGDLEIVNESNAPAEGELPAAVKGF